MASNAELRALLAGLRARINQHTRDCIYGRSSGDEGDCCSCGKQKAREDFDRVTAALAEKEDGGWIKTSDRLPKCNRKGKADIEVLILPRSVEYGATAFFGKRITNSPCFYKYGSVVYVTEWQPLPPLPERNG